MNEGRAVFQQKAGEESSRQRGLKVRKWELSSICLQDSKKSTIAGGKNWIRRGLAHNMERQTEARSLLAFSFKGMTRW